MSAGLEAMTVQEWIVATLSGDETAVVGLQALAGDANTLLDRLWEGEYKGSEDEAPWWISFTVSDPVDIKGVSMIQVMSRVQFQVKVVARGDTYTPALPVYQRAHTLLESQINQVTSGGLVLTCERVSGFQFPERSDGIEYRHLGGRYEALSQ